MITEPHVDSTEKTEDQPLLKCTDTDVSFELLLQNIENLQCRVRTLKSGISEITSRNVSRFSSSENFSLILHGDVQTSSAQSPTNSAGNGYTASVGVGGIYNSSQHAADEFEFADFVFPDSCVSSFGEATSIPDIIESTVGLLAAADVTLQSALVADSGEHVSFLKVWISSYNFYQFQFMTRTRKVFYATKYDLFRFHIDMYLLGSFLIVAFVEKSCSIYASFSKFNATLSIVLSIIPFTIYCNEKR